MKRRRLYPLLVVSLFVVLVPIELHATMGHAVEVTQPIIDREGGIWLSRMTYTAMLGAVPAGVSVPYTCSENCVLDDSDESTNRNLASLAGLKAGVYMVTDNNNQGESLFGDTLRVYLDMSGVDFSREKINGVSLERVIRATYQCLLINASRDRGGYNRQAKAIKAKYLHLEIIGSDQHADWAGVYKFDDKLGQFPPKPGSRF